jgi:hypothetical protein
VKIWGLQSEQSSKLEHLDGSTPQLGRRDNKASYVVSDGPSLLLQLSCRHNTGHIFNGFSRNNS